MHQVQIYNAPCDGNADPITVQVYSAVNRDGGELIRHVDIPVGGGRTVLIPAGAMMCIAARDAVATELTTP